MDFMVETEVATFAGASAQAHSKCAAGHWTTRVITPMQRLRTKLSAGLWLGKALSSAQLSVVAIKGKCSAAWVRCTYLSTVSRRWPAQCRSPLTAGFVLLIAYS
jgi:hypothetical protein